MKKSDASEKSKKIDYKLITFSVIVVCYLAMYVIISIAAYEWYGNYGYSDVGYIVINIFKYLFIGMLIYLIPYEYLISNVRQELDYLVEWFDLSEKTKKIMKIVLSLSVYIFACGIYYWYIDEFFIRPWNRTHYALFYALGLVVLVKCISLIKNKYKAATFALIFILLNSYVIYSFCDKVLFVSVVMVATGITWFVYSLWTKKMSLSVGIASVITMGAGFMHLVIVADRLESLSYFFNGWTFRTGESQIVERMINGKPPYNHGDYIFTQIYYAFGYVGLIAFGLLFVGLSIATIYSIWKLAESSKNRAGVALGIYMLFLGVITYCVAQELGVLPVSTIIPFSININFLLMALAFRTFNLNYS